MLYLIESYDRVCFVLDVARCIYLGIYSFTRLFFPLLYGKYIFVCSVVFTIIENIWRFKKKRMMVLFHQR